MYADQYQGGPGKEGYYANGPDQYAYEQQRKNDRKRRIRRAGVLAAAAS